MDLKEQLAELKAALETSTDSKMKAELAVQIKAVQDAMAAEVKKTNDELRVELKTATDAVEALKGDVKELKAKGGRLRNPESGVDVKEAFTKEIKENKEQIKAAVTTGAGEVEVKADTLRSSISTNNHTFQIPGIGQLARIRRALYNLFAKVTVPNGNTNGTIAYTDWDEDTTVKAASAKAEGTAFDESTAKFKGYTLQLRKIGDTLPVSEEFFEDEEMAAQELALFLNVNVESEIDDQLVNGDNTGQNLKGLLVSIDAYVPTSAGIVDPNIYDLITKVEESITKTKGSKYQPDFVAMNRTTMNQLLLKKDANYQYLFPPSHPIYNMIVEDNNMPDNQLVVGDSRFARVYEKSGVMLSRGEVNAQFTSDMTTIKARKRLNMLIRAADKGGFAKVTNITDALAAIA